MEQPPHKVHLYTGLGFKCGLLIGKIILRTTNPADVTCKKCLMAIEASKHPPKNRHGR